MKKSPQAVLVLAALLIPLMSRQANTEPVPRPVVSWMSTGDSFSSGQGVTGVEGQCAISDRAWGPRAAQILEQDHGWTVEPLVHNACTSSVMRDFYDHKSTRRGTRGSLWQWAQSQGLPVGERFDIVTLTFGGNDIGFADVLHDCRYGINPLTAKSWSDRLRSTDLAQQALDGCDVGLLALEERVKALETNTDGVVGPHLEDQGDVSLSQLYQAIAENHLTPNGHLVVLGYPDLFAPVAQWPGYEGRRCHGVRKGDATLLSAIAWHLDATIRLEVVEANRKLSGHRIHHLSVRDLYKDAGQSHSLCGRGSDWLNGVTGADLGNNSFHPTAAGYDAEATRVSDCLSGSASRQCDGLLWKRSSLGDAAAEVDWEAVVRNPDCIYESEGYQTTAGLAGVHDLTGDGAAEAIVVVSCEASTSSWPGEVWVFDGASDPEQPSRLAVLLADDPAYPRALVVSFQGSSLTVEASAMSAEASFAAPDLTLRQSFSWNNGDFEAGPQELTPRCPIDDPACVEGDVP